MSDLCPHCEGEMDEFGGMHLASCPLANAAPTQPVPSHLSEEVVREKLLGEIEGRMAELRQREATSAGACVRGEKPEAENAAMGVLDELDDFLTGLVVNQPAASLSASSETGGAGAGLQDLTVGEAIDAFKAITVYSEAFPEPNLDAVRTKLLARINPDPATLTDLEAKSHATTSPQQSVPDSGERLTLKVVVSGAPFEVGINRVQPIAALIDSALLGAGIKRRVDIGTWHVRTEQGVILESLAAVQDGATLFLDPEAGGGASEVESEQISGSQDAEPPKNDPSPAESARIEAPQPDPPGEVPGREGEHLILNDEGIAGLLDPSPDGDVVAQLEDHKQRVESMERRMWNAVEAIDNPKVKLELILRPGREGGDRG